MSQAMQCLQSAHDCMFCWILPESNMIDIYIVPQIQSITKTLMSAMRPVLNCFCVAAVNPTEEYKRECYPYLNTRDHLISEQFLLMGPSGCALSIKLPEKKSTDINPGKG